MKAVLALTIFTLAGALAADGCTVRVQSQDAGSHDENAARAEADAFLRLLYLQEDVQGAFARISAETRSRFPADALRRLLAMVKERHGDVLELRADTFAPTLGKDALSIAYVARNARGNSYHRVVLIRRAGRYQVIEVWFSEKPYGRGILTEAFKNAPVLKRSP